MGRWVGFLDHEAATTPAMWFALGLIWQFAFGVKDHLLFFTPISNVIHRAGINIVPSQNELGDNLCCSTLIWPEMYVSGGLYVPDITCSIK